MLTQATLSELARAGQLPGGQVNNTASMTLEKRPEYLMSNNLLPLVNFPLGEPRSSFGKNGASDTELQEVGGPDAYGVPSATPFLLILLFLPPLCTQK